MTTPRPLLALAGAVLAAACGSGETSDTPRDGSNDPAPAAATVTVDPARPGTVFGTVRLDGEPPEPKEYTSARQYPGCGAHGTPRDESLVASDGKLANAIVYVRRVPDELVTPAPTEPVVLEQRGCVYRPHVVALRVGQPLHVRNGDSVRHNVHAQPQRATAGASASLNRNQDAGDADQEWVFDDNEIIPFKCDLHPWMSAWVATFDHSFFAVSAADGAFAIEGLPPGRYEIVAWHESWPRSPESRTVELTDAGGAGIELTFRL